MSRSLVKKLKFVVVVLAVLAMMIPTAIPVSAAYPVLNMYLIDPITGLQGDADGGYNIQGSSVLVTSDIPVNWSIDYSQGGYAQIDYDNTDNMSVVVDGGLGEVSIVAKDEADNHTSNVNKKWDTIDYTEFESDHGSSTVAWNQTSGAFFAMGSITDRVIGEMYGNPLQGAILNWYLVDSTAVVPMTPMESDDLKAAVEALTPAYFVQFLPASYDESDPGTWLGTMLTRENGMATVTDINGESTVEFGAWGEEAVKIVVVPEYPNDPQETVVAEVATWNFDTFEYEVVPQVRWVGEKIVLEKDFGLTGNDVNFIITSGEGALERLENDNYPTYNNGSNGQSVWTETNEYGVASVILTSDAANQVNVRASIYADDEEEYMVAQQSFTVYFLKFESLRLSDVVGKRTEHNAGTWMDPVNPYNEAFPYWADEMEEGYTGASEYPDVDEQDRNVSQDALERAQVKGWFMGVNKSTRPEGLLDVDGDEDPDITLPQYRWVLPDDWDKLGAVNFQRIHWDIMDAPNDNIVSDYKDGPFYDGLVQRSGDPLIGPFTPGIEVMTPAGWSYAINSTDEARQYVTVVEDDLINEWDAPMPPAKIIFKINDGNGYFKEAFKGDIYIDAGQYTNPFYYAMIPAHWAIPAFNSEGGYDWNSFNATYGAYEFWETINQYASDVPTSDVANYPTAMEVYSDNHGEAMVYLNGDWNLDLDSYNLIGGKDGVDAMDGEEVGMTEVQATADYPYFRVENAVMSNTVMKTWYWNGLILGIDNHTYANWNPLDPNFDDEKTSEATLNILSAGDYTLTFGNANPDEDGLDANGRGYSNDKMVFIWARDRDGLAGGMLGARVDINNITEGPYILQTPVQHAVSQYNWVTKGIFVSPSGFLSGTNGVRTSPTTGYCFFKEPSEAEIELFERTYGSNTAEKGGTAYEDANGEILDPADFVVAGFDLYYSGTCDSTVEIVISSTDFGYTGQPIGQVDYTINVNFGTGDDKYVYPLDDAIVAGDANNDGVIDILDIAMIENMIMGIEDADVNGDATQNGQINMGDVVKVIRMIRGLK